MAAKLRDLTIDDYDQIICLWQDAGLEHRPQGRDSLEMMGKEMASPHCAFFGLFEEGRMVGVGIANWDGRRGWVNRVAIDPDQRGKRYASVIIKACEDFLRECGAVVICALIFELNTPSMSCFENEGYVCDSTFKYFSKRNSPLD